MSKVKSWLKNTVGWPPGKARIEALQADLAVAYERNKSAARTLVAVLDAKERRHV